MKKLLRILLVIVAVLIVAALVVPFLIPMPPLEGTVPPEQLADPDSLFVDVGGLQVHYKEAGEGETALVLLHGFGASTFSWREMMEPLAGDGYRVVAFDRPSSGLTERPMPGEWQGESPYSPEAQADLTVSLMDALGIERAVLVGHSAGGTTAVLTTLRHPQRVEKLVLVGPAIYQTGSPLPRWVSALLRTPQMRRLGPLFVRSIRDWGQDFESSAWHDPSKLTPEIQEGYERLVRAENWDRGLWELTAASHPLDLDERLDEIGVPVLVITGDDDRIVPADLSVRLAADLPDAELVVLPNCGHIPQEECPEGVLEAVRTFLP